MKLRSTEVRTRSSSAQKARGAEQVTFSFDFEGVLQNFETSRSAKSN